MDDYIRRKDAINVVLGLTMYKGAVPLDSVLFNINKVKSADFRPAVHGEWIVDSIADNIFRCSICGQDAPVEPTGGTEYKSNFCPNCGARMDGGYTDD